MVAGKTLFAGVSDYYRVYDCICTDIVFSLPKSENALLLKGLAAMLKTILMLQILVFSARPIIAAKPIEPITINPLVATFDSIPDVAGGKLFFIDTVIDTAPSRATGVAGFTRIGRNKQTEIRCNPFAALSVRKSLAILLSKKELLTTNRDSADYALQLTIATFNLVEKQNKFFSQTMSGNVVITVSMSAPDQASPPRIFTIESSNAKTTLDTSKHAEAVLRGALQNALYEVLKGITK